MIFFSSKDTEKLCREQKIDIEKKSRENKIIQERINKLKVIILFFFFQFTPGSFQVHPQFTLDLSPISARI